MVFLSAIHPMAAKIICDCSCFAQAVLPPFPWHSLKDQEHGHVDRSFTRASRQAGA
jgi:hypothetical protein